MDASVFRSRVARSTFLPKALTHALMMRADTLPPDARERIAGNLTKGMEKFQGTLDKARTAIRSTSKKAA